MSGTKKKKYLDYKTFTFETSVRLQQYRLKAKISQKEMATRLGVSKTYISNIECGKTKVPAYILNAYCHELSISPDTMLGYVPDNTNIEKSILKEVEKMSPDLKEIIYTIAKSLADNSAL